MKEQGERVYLKVRIKIFTSSISLMCQQEKRKKKKRKKPKVKLTGFKFRIRKKWDRPELLWNQKYAELKAFRQKYGHLRIPYKDPGYKPLFKWVQRQKEHRKNKTISLTEDRIKKLDKIGFEWDIKPRTDWDAMYRKLIDFRRKSGHTNVPRRNEDLYGWALRQKINFRLKKKALTASRIDQLNRIGFKWTTKIRQTWEEMFSRLQAFYKGHHHSRVPATGTQYKNLYTWAVLQRANRKKKIRTLTRERIAMLDKLKFKWQFRDSALLWDSMYNQLKEYHRKYGHCKVVWNEKGSNRLAKWAQRQTYHYKLGILSTDKIKKLKALNFFEDTFRYDNRWHNIVEELKLFKSKYGHCNTYPYKKQYPHLHRWCIYQRAEKKNFHPKLIRVLDEVGFMWSLKEFQWEKNYKAAKEFYSKHNNLSVPRNTPEGRKLSKWIYRQREDYHANKITPARRKQLRAIGFR